MVGPRVLQGGEVESVVSVDLSWKLMHRERHAELSKRVLKGLVAVKILVILASFLKTHVASVF